MAFFEISECLVWMCLTFSSGSFLIRGQEVGEHELQVALACDQLTGIRATANVNVVAGDTSKPVLSESDELSIEDVDFKV